jgi:hypothetical protein
VLEEIMLLIKESKDMTEAATGTKYSIQPKASTTPIPRRFYCHWTLPGDEIQYDDKGKALVDDPQLRCCFNHRVGLPQRKWETEKGVEVVTVELTHFNRRMMQNYFRHRKYSKNKCRGDGTTELLTVRWNVFKYGVMGTVKNRKCVIMPGTSSKLSNEISTRIKALCDKIPQIYKHGIPISESPQKFFFKTDNRIELTSATPDADRGYENVGDINEEEVAHWELVDDKPVFYSSEGVHEKTRCHITHNTTPRGKRGFYFELVWSPEATSGFYKHIVNWREVVGLPVVKIEDLYGIGHIDDAKLAQLRKQLVQRYYDDPSYKNWYETFEKSGVRVFWDNGELIPIEEIVDIPIPILDINSIVNDSQEERSHYDQELDNEFISGENRAIGVFQEADFKPDDLAAQIQQYNKGLLEQRPFNKDDFE